MNPSPWSSKSTTDDRAARHKIQASGWAAASLQPKSGTDTTHHVHLVPSASEPLRQGFVRVINHSTEAGEASIDPVDDGGRVFDTITLSINANETVHFNSNDLETGNEGKGLTGSTGAGQGAWRLAFTSALDIEVLSYIRTTDGFLTAMHDVAPADGDVRRVAIFNPGSNKNQVSRLRLINPTDTTANIAIRGTDDNGMPASGKISLSLDAGTAREITAEQLEEGGTGLTGMLGDGSGKWRLEVESEQAVVALSLLESPTDHLTNLSTVPEEPENGVHSVPLFPAAGDESGRQGFVRVINGSTTEGEVRIKAYDDTERDYEPLTLTIGANEVVHFNSDDLEQGSPSKGLSGGTGAGEGDWRLELTSELEIEVLSYIRTTDGFLTAMHDVAPSAETRHRVAVFNPGSNRNQESLLRLINPGEETAEVTITGIDDKGAAGAGAVSLSLPGGGSRTVGAWDLESGAEGLGGALGDGSGKWQLMIESDLPVVAMSLLRSPTGHMTNLSTAPGRGARGGAVQAPQTAEAVFRELISGPIVQSKCVSCHVEGGASGNTRLVFVPDSDPDHAATNLQVFREFLDAEEDGGAGYILNKIQGALGHGGGIQVAAGTDEYANMERFLSLLGQDVGPVSITPETLFEGVNFEPHWKTLRRAAIIFAGRIPTEEEYESVETGGLLSLRTAVRSLMQGPEFHEFLIRASNDRLLTDRDLGKEIVPPNGFFVDHTNELYRLIDRAGGDPRNAPEAWDWVAKVQFGAGRAPLELIAHVVENDLPYAEILTANYIMANPQSAMAYGASTAFDDLDDVSEFRPSKIASYYRDDDSKVTEVAYETFTILRVLEPGNLLTVYPHAGILNTTAFLLRYPTTATNRNRARSRWTYYHFLGLDIEKSASRTTDPVALADTNHPTLHNSACTVCHSVLDPVAGTFQNYGDEGLYRDNWGGQDSLDDFYKYDPPSRMELEVNARSPEHKETLVASGWLTAGSNEIGVGILNAPNSGSTNIHVDYVDLLDADGTVLSRYEMEALEGLEELDDYCAHAWDGFSVEIYGRCVVAVPVEVPSAGDYRIEVAAWIGYQNEEAAADSLPGTLRVWVGGHFFRDGDTWYRDMLPAGFDGELVSDADASLPWLARRIVEDDRFSEATVRFWWPAIMGRDVAEPPEDQNDANFEGSLLASNVQTAEVKRLARGFRHGFGERPPYNLKDLLAEMVLSRWFRASRLTDVDPVRAVALRGSGAKRLLTPEELSRKTSALMGFDWQRSKSHDTTRGAANWTNAEAGYGLLYGGIDSDGITKRGRNLTPVMAGVAQRLAAATSCPVVMKDFYLVSEDDRRLLDGIDLRTTPTSEFGTVFEIEGASREEIESLSITGSLQAGEATVLLAHRNSFFEDTGHGHRGILLDRLIVRSGESIVYELELENLDHPVECHHVEQEAFHLSTTSLECVLRVPVDISSSGRHTIEILAWADRAGDELAKLEVSVESDTERSAGSGIIKAKLAELHGILLGVEADEASVDVQVAYDLFVEAWGRGRDSGNGDFLSVRCDFLEDQYYFDGIADELWRDAADAEGNPSGWDWDLVDEFIHETEMGDPHHVARTWVTVLAYLMTDYRYLHL